MVRGAASSSSTTCTRSIGRTGTARLAVAGLVTAAGLIGCSNNGQVADPVVAPQTGWEVTVYYTAVEHFHDGPPRRVTGCLVLDCADGRDHLGYYPSDFVDAVEFEGTGRLETGRYAGRYLNWSHDVGFWVDDVPRDSSGGALVPFVSAAADPDVLPSGTSFQIVGCGTSDDGSPVLPAVCEKFTGPHWTIDDEFTPGLGGDRHVDLYVGEETSTTFAESRLSTTLIGAELAVAVTVGPPEADPPDPADPGGQGPFGTGRSTTTTTAATTTTTTRPTATTRPPLVP
jgi:hypothetical protein